MLEVPLSSGPSETHTYVADPKIVKTMMVARLTVLATGIPLLLSLITLWISSVIMWSISGTVYHHVEAISQPSSTLADFADEASGIAPISALLFILATTVYLPCRYVSRRKVEKSDWSHYSSGVWFRMVLISAPVTLLITLLWVTVILLVTFVAGIGTI